MPKSKEVKRLEACFRAACTYKLAEEINHRYGKRRFLDKYPTPEDYLRLFKGSLKT